MYVHMHACAACASLQVCIQDANLEHYPFARPLHHQKFHGSPTLQSPILKSSACVSGWTGRRYQRQAHKNGLNCNTEHFRLPRSSSPKIVQHLNVTSPPLLHPFPRVSDPPATPAQHDTKLSFDQLFGRLPDVHPQQVRSSSWPGPPDVIRNGCSAYFNMIPRWPY